MQVVYRPIRADQSLTITREAPGFYVIRRGADVLDERTTYSSALICAAVQSAIGRRMPLVVEARS